MLDRASHQQQATLIRRAVVELLYTSGGGHFGGSLSLIDLLLVIWRDFLNLEDEVRDRFVLSKGHAAPALYCVMHALGRLNPDALTGLGQDPAAMAMHPEIGRPELSDFSTGSLGQGLSAALGMALLLRTRQRRAWVVLGDGECQEGQIWEAAMLASRLRVANLVAVVDCNGRQEWGYRDGPSTPVLGLAEKWRAFGWRVVEVDGHDADGLRAAFDGIVREPADAPAVVLATTIKGRGVPMMMADPDRFHCATLDAREFAMLEI